MARITALIRPQNVFHLRRAESTTRFQKKWISNWNRILQPLYIRPQIVFFRLRLKNTRLWVCVTQSRK